MLFWLCKPFSCKACPGIDAWEDNTLQERADVRRHVLPDVVSGSIVPGRLFCAGCSAVSDVLERKPCVKLLVGSAKQQSLPGMLDKDFKIMESRTLCVLRRAVVAGLPACEAAIPGKRTRCHVFHLTRAQQEWWWLIVPSSSHEVLTCMRTRAYHFASFALHKGCASNQGHYLATYWNGSVRYTEYNDDVIKDVAWQDVATKQVQGEAYALVYVRIPGHALHEGVYRDKKESVHWSAAMKKERFSFVDQPVINP